MTSSGSSLARPRPPQAPKRTGEQAPLLPPVPQSAPSRPPSISRHGRSRSEFVIGASLHTAPQSDPNHPFNRGPPPSPVGAGGGNRPPSGPLRSGSSFSNPPPPPQQPTFSPLVYDKPKTSRSSNAHRRAKSDIPLAIFQGGDTGSLGGGRLLTKSDLLKNFPDPRWGGAKRPLNHARNRSFAGSDGPLLDSGSVHSGFSGYGATGSSAIGSNHPPLGSIGSVELRPDARRSTGRHVRAMSDASIKSVTTDMAKSALFKGVTATGRIQLQLPKDSFRILMDSQLEAGHVYKRKLVDCEDEFFVEFHTEEDGPPDGEGQKQLPPDLYVMAVDSTIYRRMLDEVIASRTMPCGTYYCGHHEDVRHPDITIAALLVGLIFFLMLAGTFI